MREQSVYIGGRSGRGEVLSRMSKKCQLLRQKQAEMFRSNKEASGWSKVSRIVRW